MAEAGKLDKIDFKKELKHLYAPRKTEIIDVPEMSYLMIDGSGDPGISQEYRDAIEALYPVSYALKFMIKKGPGIDYGVLPLEGLWWADDPRVFHSRDKSTWKWTAMILQPDFIGRKEVDTAFEEVRRKKNPAALDRVRLETLTEGPSAQILYVGPFADEGPTIQRIHDLIHAAAKELRGKHHEIYLNNLRRTAPEKLKTIIRQPMR